LVRADFDVYADDWLTKMAQRVETVVAELEAKLVFALGVETAMTFVARGIIGALALFVDVNFGMNFMVDHRTPPRWIRGARVRPSFWARKH
jgi:hypothetical protein